MKGSKFFFKLCQHSKRFSVSLTPTRKVVNEILESLQSTCKNLKEQEERLSNQIAEWRRLDFSWAPLFQCSDWRIFLEGRETSADDLWRRMTVTDG